MLRLHITSQRYKSAIFQQILMKFGTQTNEYLLSPKKRITDGPTPFSKMAAAAMFKTP
jgi:hypothetical protein